jgi:hydrophobe/amphiphile efflux-1 (HAE1) family protein
MMMSFLIIFGGISFLRMGVSNVPDVDLPVISISATLDGAAPAVMESDVVDIIEDGVMSIEGVKNVSSSSRNSAANITIEFELSRDIDLAFQDVQTKLAQIQRRLPREMDPPSISKSNPDDQPIVWLSLESSKFATKDMMLYVRDYLKDRFSTIPGVGEVFLGGFLDPNLRIWVSDKKLNDYNLTVSDLINTISTEHLEPPAGDIESGKKEYNIRTLGEAASVEDFGNIVINKRGGQPNYAPIPIKDICRIEEGTADIRRMSRGNSVPGVGLGIRKQRGTNAVEVSTAVFKRIEEIKKDLPPGMELSVNYDGTKYIKDSVRELNFTLLLAAIFTAIVCWIFLGSWTSTLNVILAIPTSVVGTFIVLYFSNFTLNNFTLLGLSLVIGIVVDDAIMVLENIIRHRELGESKVTAALIGSKEITFAALVSTISIVAIFLPVVFMRGIIGKFFFQFGVTITVAVLLSLVEALTLTPMRCSQFVEAGGMRKTYLGRMFNSWMQGSRNFYKVNLSRALNHPWKVIFVSLLIFAISLYSLKFLRKEFQPAQDISIFMLRLQTPVGSSLTFTNEKVKLVEKFLAGRKEVKRYFVQIGGFMGGQVNTGFSFVTLKDRGQRGIDSKLDREMTQLEFMDLVRKELNKIPDLKATVQDPSTQGFSSSRGFPIEFTLQGPDWDQLAEHSTIIMNEMNKTSLFTDVDTDYQVGMPEIHVIPDRVKASLRGVSVGDIGNTISAMIGGVLVGRYPKGGHRYDIRLKLEDDKSDPQDKVKRLFVRNNRGELVPLYEVVKIEEKPTLQTISRKNRERAVGIFANVAKGQSQQVVLASAEEIARKNLPEGYRLVIGGSSQTFQESFQSLIFALILGLIVAYMVLASQFNSYLDPFSVLMALPFSVSGAFVALLIGRQSVNMYSMIGLILLMGIVKKNSILLVDFTNQVRARGVVSVKDALIEACPIRFRPIIMTSFSTIAGAVPAALALGPGAESRTPMATSIIGGVLLSTMLTLFVVPCVYSKLSRLERRRYSNPTLTTSASFEKQKIREMEI